MLSHSAVTLALFDGKFQRARFSNSVNYPIPLTSADSHKQELGTLNVSIFPLLAEFNRKVL